MKKYFLIVLIILFSIPFSVSAQNKQAGISGYKITYLLVPQDEVIEQNSIKEVFKVSKDERVCFILVKIICYNGSYAAVTTKIG